MHHQPTVAAYNATEEAADGLSLGRASPTCKEERSSSPACSRDLVGHGEHDRATQREVRTQLDETRRTVVAAVPEAGGASVVPVIDHRLARGLHEFAEAENASILVLGSSHRRPLGRRLIGGTADVVLSGAPCPVAVAPPDYNKSANPLSLSLRRRLLRLADGKGCARPRGAAGAGGRRHAAADRRPPHGDAQELEWGLAEAAATVPSQVPCKTVLEAGDPATRLLDQGEDEVGLLLAGSRGHGPLRRVLLEVSRGLVARPACRSS